MFSISRFCMCDCHAINWFGICPPVCTCLCGKKQANQKDNEAIKQEVIKQINEALQSQPLPNPTNQQVLQESVLSHIHGINKVINLYDRNRNQNLKHARTLLNVVHELIIKGLSAND